MRTPWQIQQAVIKALLIRELKTRFGSSPLGYAWAIIGPFLQILIMVLIFSAINRAGYQGLPYPLFFAPAILLLNFLTSMMTSGAATIKANKGLFNYKQVKPFDAFVTRLLLESTIMLVVFVVIFLVYLWWGYEIHIQNPLLAFAIIISLAMLGLGFAIIFGSLNLYFKDTEKLIPLLTRPLFFISCVMYPLIVVPQEYLHFFLWNPLVHAIELMRIALYANYLSPDVDLFYLFQCGLVSLFIGLLFYRTHWQRMVAT